MNSSSIGNITAGNVLSGSSSIARSPSRNIAKINQTSQNFNNYKSKKNLDAKRDS